MTEAVDIQGALAGLEVLRLRGPETTEAEAAAAFARLGQVGEAGLFAGSFSGRSPWERHARGDELVHVLAGAATLTILGADGVEELDLRAGTLVVVPRGRWHRFDAPGVVTLLTATPQPTDETWDDPRAAE